MLIPKRWRDRCGTFWIPIMAESVDFVAQLAALHEQYVRQIGVARDDLISLATE